MNSTLAGKRNRGTFNPLREDVEKLRDNVRFEECEVFARRGANESM